MSVQPRDSLQRPAGPEDPASGPPDSSDTLTGILNRASFDERLAQEWNRARREQTPLSLLLVDIDHFRAYVDTHVAAMGQDRLKKIAATLGRAVFRPADVVARHGDDEFAILLPAVHEIGARVVAARVRMLINALAMPHSGGEGGIVTVSIGVAALTPTAGVGPEVLVQLCKGALEQAKRMGRDNIVSQEWMA
jgi:diguanylate cyclase (GGDEF)-like protein